jgi:hypothetical protein
VLVLDADAAAEASQVPPAESLQLFDEAYEQLLRNL